MIVLALFQSAREYVNWLKTMQQAGAITMPNGSFSHFFEIGDYMIYTKLCLGRYSELEKFCHQYKDVLWIMCKDFYPDDMELNLFKSRLHKEGAITSRELFIICPHNVKPSLKIIQ